MTKEECIAAFEPMKPEVVLIELDRIPEAVSSVKRDDGKIITLVRPERLRVAQEQQSESGRIVKMYQPSAATATTETEEAREPAWYKYKVGDRVTFMDYVCPRGPFQKFPQLRVMSLTEIIGKLNTEEAIVE